MFSTASVTPVAADVELDRLVGPDDLTRNERSAPAGHGDRLVQRDELGAVGERRLDLDLGEHLGDALHHVVAGEHVPSVLHQIGDTPTVAGGFEHPGGEHRDRLGVVQPEPRARRASATPAA